jgi:hypothetical protein
VDGKRIEETASEKLLGIAINNKLPGQGLYSEEVDFITLCAGN